MSHKKHDAQLREFKKRDLGKDIERSLSSVVIRPKHKKSVDDEFKKRIRRVMEKHHKTLRKLANG